jgi:hypothetical protein
VTLRFWPEYPYMFRDYHREIPAFEQTADEANKVVDKAQDKGNRRKLKRLKAFVGGGFNVLRPKRP